MGKFKKEDEPGMSKHVVDRFNEEYGTLGTGVLHSFLHRLGLLTAVHVLLSLQGPQLLLGPLDPGLAHRGGGGGRRGRDGDRPAGPETVRAAEHVPEGLLERTEVAGLLTRLYQRAELLLRQEHVGFNLTGTEGLSL